MSADRIDAIPTQWSLIQRALTSGTPASAEDARRLLVMRYAPAMRKYLGRICHHPDAADDLAQDVLVRLLRGDFASADPNRGRFRDFLKTAIRNLARNHWAKEAVRKPADFDLTLLGAESEMDDQWLTEWRNTILDHAWNHLKAAEHEYAVLRLRVDHPDETSEQLATRYSVGKSQPVRADAVRQILRRARIRFADAIIHEIQTGLDHATPERVEDELINLGLRDVVQGFRSDHEPD